MRKHILKTATLYVAQRQTSQKEARQGPYAHENILGIMSRPGEAITRTLYHHKHLWKELA